MMRPIACCLAAALVAAGCAGTDGGDGSDGGGAGFGGEGGGGGEAGFGGEGGFGGGGGQGGIPSGNQRPELRRIGDREAPVGSQLEIRLDASDPEGRPLQYNVRSSLPEGAKFDKVEGVFTWTPTPEQEGIIVLITFEVSDGELKDQETIQISVVPAGQGNSPPVLEEIGDQPLVAGRLFELQLVATDRNGDPVTYSMRGDELPGAMLDANTGHFSWTPGLELAGQSYRVTFVASDGQAEATAEVKLVISREGEQQNLPPRITPIDDREVRVGEMVRLVVTAEDDDPGSLTFGVAGALPEGASFDADSATFTWTPRADQVNQAFPVVFQVSDGEFRAVERVTFQVLPGQGGNGGNCQPDAREGAEPIALQSGQTLDGLSICPVSDIDRFTFMARAGETYVVTVQFDHDLGDIDVRVLDPNGAPAGGSTGLDDVERVERRAMVAGQYTIEVYTASNPNPAYSISLEIRAGQPMGCMDDALDNGGGNDTAQTAADLRAAVGQQLQICADDPDYYAVDLMAGARFVVRARFSHRSGDLDMALTHQELRFTASSSSDDEAITLDPVPRSGRYVLHVYGFQGAENAYRLEVEEGAPPMCAADRVEPNDTHGNAEPFRPELYTRLTWCGDDDWYKTEVAADQRLEVFISYDGAAPQMEAFTAANQRVAGQSYGVAQGGGCRAGRAGCRLLVAAGSGGFTHYVVRGGQVGQEYDLSVRVERGQQGPACSAQNEVCPEDEVCDYETGTCVTAFCDARGAGCTADYECYQEWCVGFCGDGGTCTNPSHVCKILDGLDNCAVPGPGALGAACVDFSDCAGANDCLTEGAAGFPGGYCSRLCERDADCPGGACGMHDGVRICGKTCQNDGQCRGGYGCNVKARAAGGTVMMCTPGFEI